MCRHQTETFDRLFPLSRTFRASIYSHRCPIPSLARSKRRSDHSTTLALSGWLPFWRKSQTHLTLPCDTEQSAHPTDS